MTAAKLSPKAATPTASPSPALTTKSIAPPTNACRRLRASLPSVNSRPRKKSRKTMPISATKSVTSDGWISVVNFGSFGPSSRPASR